MDQPEIKLCPFCGDEAKLYCIGGYWQVQCVNAGCQSRGYPFAETEFVAITMWNRRARSSGEIPADTQRLTELRETYEEWMSTEEAPDADACSDTFARFCLALQDVCYPEERAVSPTDTPATDSQ